MDLAQNTKRGRELPRTHIVNMAAACGLQSDRDVLLVSYFEDIIDDVEFTVLSEEHYPREIFPHREYDNFDLDGWDVK